MEKEQILSTLSDKLGKTSLSARTIEAYVNSTLPDEGQEPDEAYWTKGVAILQALNGQLSHDVANIVSGLRKNQKAENEEVKAEPVAEVKEQEPSVISELKEKLEKLTGELEGIKTSAKRAELLKSVKAEMQTSYGAHYDERIFDYVIDKAEIDLSKDAKEIAKGLTDKYNAEYTKWYSHGPSPHLTGGNAVGSKEKSVSDRFFERKKARESWKTPSNN